DRRRSESFRDDKRDGDIPRANHPFGARARERGGPSRLALRRRLDGQTGLRLERLHEAPRAVAPILVHDGDTNLAGRRAIALASENGREDRKEDDRHDEGQNERGTVVAEIHQPVPSDREDHSRSSRPVSRRKTSSSEARFNVKSLMGAPSEWNASRSSRIWRGGASARVRAEGPCAGAPRVVNFSRR